MTNEANIIPHQFDANTARTAGKKGGPAAAAARRRNKTMREFAKLMIDSSAPQEVSKVISSEFDGTDAENITVAAAIVYKQVKAAVDGSQVAADWVCKLADIPSLCAGNLNYELSPLVFTNDFVTAYRIMREVLEGKRKDIREAIFKGGRGGVKSTWVSEFAYETMMRDPQAHVVFTRRYKTDLRGSIYSQWERTVGRLGDVGDWEFTKSPMMATYKATGQRVMFLGCDKPISLKSHEVPFGYVKLLIHEEANEMAGVEQMDDVEDTFLRKDAPSLDIKIFNPPPSAADWMNAYTAQKTTDPNSIVCSANYLSVPIEWLGQRFFDRAEWFKEHKPAYYANHYLGEVTGTSGELFGNVTASALPANALEFPAYQGVDFGWDHPQVFVLCTFDRENDTIYIIEEHYARQCKLETFLEPIKVHMCNETICDSASPRDIAGMQEAGWNATGASKRWKGGGRDYSWEWIRSRAEIVIDPNICPNLFHELTTLEFHKNSDGTFSSRYPDIGEDGIAALRYALNRVMMEPTD